MIKEDIIITLNLIKLEIKEKMEKIFRGKIVFESQDGLTLQLAEDKRTRVLIQFTDKKMKVANIAGSALVAMNHITKEQEKVLIAYNRQLRSVSHTIAIIHNYQGLPSLKQEEKMDALF